MVVNTGITLTITRLTAAAEAAGDINAANIQVDPSVGAVAEVNVPVTENWIITDCYILAAAGATNTDPQINFDKNRGRSMGTTPPLTSMLVTNNTRPRFLPQPIGFEGGSILRIFTINTALTAVAQTVTAYAAVAIS
jgi:hypothetical protein